MIGIILVTHGNLAKEFLAISEHIVGKQPALLAICVESDGDLKSIRGEILAAVAAVESGKGVVILTDMFGGTPSNLAISVIPEGNIEVIAGLNLPMLIKLITVRHNHNLVEAVISAQEAGRKYINVASNLLKNVPDTAIATVIIQNNKGLHARPAAKIVKCAALFKSEIKIKRLGEPPEELKNESLDWVVSARSILGLMMLAAEKGVELEITACGEDAEAAVQALELLIQSKFHEDE